MTATPPTDTMAPTAPPETRTIAEEMELLCSAVMRAIQTAGAEINLPLEPTPSEPPLSRNDTSNSCGTGTVSWVEYAPSCSREAAVVSELRQQIGSLEARLGPSCDVASAVDTSGRPLIYAACLGLLLSDDPKGADRAGEGATTTATTTTTPLSVFLEILSFLSAEVGASVDQPTEKSGACHRLPIHLVARACRPAAIRAVLDVYTAHPHAAAADPSAQDDEGWSALMACCMSDFSGRDGAECEGGPSMEDRVETARLLLDQMKHDEESDGSIDDINFQGYTALHLACRGLMAPLVKLFLEYGGADPTARTFFGESPLGIVLWNEEGDPQAAEVCREHLLAAIDKHEDREQYLKYAEEEKKMVELIRLLDEVLIPEAEGHGSTDDKPAHAKEQDLRLLFAIMKHIGMDISLLTNQNQRMLSLFGSGKVAKSNWYEELHRRVMALVPDAFLKVYLKNPPTEDEFDLITSHDGDAKDEAEFHLDDDSGARRIDVDVLRESALIQFRHRGAVASVMDNFVNLVLNPIQQNIAYAVPSNDVLDRIKHHAPKLVEVGAGTGYWSSVLRQNNVDVIAYDSDPPSPNGDKGGKGTNAWLANRAFTSVLKGNGSEVFCGQEGKRLASDRALLIVWPNNPDHVDNAHLPVQDEKDVKKLPLWDTECLSAYIDAGGTTVIYVGEREEKIDSASPDCGFCSSRHFQQMLQERFDLIDQVDCPKWCFKEDDVTIWRLRS